ncbi:nitrate assimilation regulatory protein nirA [Cordyceps javanica]|uniref:Nitrate assimilation regulatory protein nirA n=1 Tax=Cordyceps javanica TaxID=43265 RepID=A0A545UL34_9HYPO|nr:nitrate assimilation regulatory protein nirA [Cordyceps javanica]
MNPSPQRRNARQSTQQSQDIYTSLLSDCTDDIENSLAGHKSPRILALLYSCYSWWSRLRNILPPQLHTYSRQLYAVKMAGKLLLRCARATRVLPTVLVATVFGFLAAVSFTWIWWFARRHCIWVVYRLVIPFVLNSLIALIPTSIPAIDDAQWSRSVLAATAVFAVWIYAFNSTVQPSDQFLTAPVATDESNQSSAATPVHDAELGPDLAPDAVKQGWNVAALADHHPQTGAQVDEVPGTPVGQSVLQTARQRLSHQAGLQARVQQCSAQEGHQRRHLRSPISISYGPPNTKTHRIRGRRRRRESDKGKPECSSCCEAAEAHAGYPPPSGLDWFTPGRQAVGVARPPEGRGTVPAGVYEDLGRCAAQSDHYTMQVGDQASRGPECKPHPSWPAQTRAQQPLTTLLHESAVSDAPRAMEEDVQRLPPVSSLGQTFSTPVLANIQPRSHRGGPPPGYPSAMDHGQYQAGLSEACAPPVLVGPSSLQHRRPHRLFAANSSRAIGSAVAPVGPLQQYTAAVLIGDDVLIGGNVTILPGCIIGQGSIVETGSVVTNVSDLMLTSRTVRFCWDIVVEVGINDRAAYHVVVNAG